MVVVLLNIDWHKLFLCSDLLHPVTVFICHICHIAAHSPETINTDASCSSYLHPECSQINTIWLFNIAMGNHHFSWESSLFLWAMFNSKLLVYQRVYHTAVASLDHCGANPASAPHPPSSWMSINVYEHV